MVSLDLKMAGISVSMVTFDEGTIWPIRYFMVGCGFGVLGPRSLVFGLAYGMEVRPIQNSNLKFIVWALPSAGLSAVHGTLL